ncbi:flagellar hook protein FlgE [Aliidiomarina soli]|uniref:Flagellar hook protein FlgE n=1 Tax=Aliidiomarina soli TaxID=1928574 RepID=A0A432WCT5_9GAMM|nr:flagellar hook protein FlgE [Aliidiomarina soli]RUO30222.1 flagellar hook protein FlgE [Aliidiomarina soli]
MSYFIALSGLSASQRDLDTTSNNVANVNTTGFKGSRAEFGDVYASSIFTNSRTKVGDGVQIQRVAQQFSQGTLDFTENSLDMAIKGGGFFVTAPEQGSQDYSYTRAGAFKMDRDNYIVDNSGDYLQAYPVNRETGANSSTALSTTGPVEIPTTAGSPQATDELYQSVNLDSRENAILDPFDPTDDATYSHSTSATVYDSLGEAHTVTTYYARRDDAATGETQWDVYKTVNGEMQDFDAPGGTLVADATSGGNTGVRIQFDASGRPTGPDLTADGYFEPGEFTYTPTSGADPLDIVFNFRSEGGNATPTQFASAFELQALKQNGTTVGRLTNVEINENGLIAAEYSNGSTQYLGQVALVQFNNDQGLEQVGGTKWRQTNNSGEAITGTAGIGTFGAIESSALENSNVNLTEELVDMIVAQRNYQANSRSLEVNSTLQQTILQIR